MLADEFRLRRERYQELNRVRLSKSRDIFSDATLRCLEILPVMLHFNHPKLPGYRPGFVPHGIDLLELNDFQRAFLRAQGVDPDTESPAERDIYGLYVMGSTASIGQGERSDLDVWVCVRAGMSAEQRSALTAKCAFISSMAKALRADLNLFVTPEDRFISGSFGHLDNEDCGSAQSLFLLDEFYRSSFKLCGRDITWYMVPPEEERSDYQAAVRQLKDDGLINDREWFDFGPVQRNSPEEFFGSGLWQLYKGIDSPFKAVLKILLIEAYSAEYPYSELLSTELKGLLHRQHLGYSMEFDAYYLMYRRVTEYLRGRHDFERLKLAQRCFYLKIRSSMNSLPPGEALNTRRRLLTRLLRIWGWQPHEERQLQNMDSWGVQFVATFGQQLFSCLLKSYRALLGFSVRHRIEYAITSDDAGVISRKLHAAYDVYPGKVPLLNSGIRPLAGVSDLVLVHTAPGSTCREGWYLYPSRLDSLEQLGQRELYFAPDAVQAVSWASFNNILGHNTKIILGGAPGAVTESKVRALCADIERYLKGRVSAPTETDLQKPQTVRQALVVLNFSEDESQLKSREQAQLLTRSSVLNCGGSNGCMVGSVALITLNSWGEINVIDLPGAARGIAELLVSLSRICGEALAAGQVQVCCYASGYRDLIRHDVKALLVRFLGPQAGNGSYEAGGSMYTVRVGSTGLSVFRRSLFGTKSDEIRVHSSFGMRPEFALQVPAQVSRFATVGVMQYFFSPCKSQGEWNIYVVDERNEVSTYPHFSGSRAELVNAINLFYTRQNEASLQDLPRFNLPQCFVLSADGSSIHPFTIRSSERL
ncbi:MAG: class I adenylate cyclase [Succinivibrio sp.]|nr:class I adenylate cyclase [Succinivibrio sp.]